MQYVRLSNGVKMPQLGYGVYQITKEDCERCVLDALDVGYRHIDTAQSYFNEEEVGSALVKSGIPREEIFLTTKVWAGNFGYDKAKDSVFRSLQKLQTEYIDLVLLHQPLADYYGAWRALEELYDEGRIRAVGISNFYPARMVDLCAYSRISPMVNQVETHPFYQQKAAQAWMDKYGVKMQAWAPFAEGKEGIFFHSTMQAIAQKYGKTVAQTILRWELQRGMTVIPKTVRKERMRENFDVFDFTLSAEDMEEMSSLDRNTSLFHAHDDPNTIEFFVKNIEERKKKGLL